MDSRLVVTTARLIKKAGVNLRCVVSGAPLTQFRSFSSNVDTSEPSVTEYYAKDNITEDAPVQSAPTWKGVKRFYSNVTVQPDANEPGYRVLIEGRALRTIRTNELLIPTEGLALAIAAEFASQGEYVVPATTPIYNITSSAIDDYVVENLEESFDIESDARAAKLSTFDRLIAQEEVERAHAATSSDPSSVSVTNAADILQKAREIDSGPDHTSILEQGRNQSGAIGSIAMGTTRLRELMLDYLETDTLCYRIDWDLADTSERVLRKRQDKYYDPLVNFFSESYGVQLGMALGLEELRQPEEAFVVVEDIVDQADPFLKAFYAHVVGSLRSTVLSVALAHGQIDPEAAVETARVEEEWQISEHGFVEDGHDTQRAFLKLNISAAMVYLDLLPARCRPQPLPNKARLKKDFENEVQRLKKIREERVKARRAEEEKIVRKKRAMLLERARRDALEAFQKRKVEEDGTKLE